MTVLIWASVFITIMMVVLMGRMISEAFRKKVIPIEIVINRIPISFDGSRILFITDIHRRILPRRLLKSLQGQVDWVFLAGDITEKNVPMSRVERNMRLLKAIAPIYAVHGNHDYEAKTSSLDHVLERCDVELLMNRNVRLVKDGDHIWLTGMDYPPLRKRSYPALPKLPSREKTTCRIVLVHDPAWINRYSVKPADLTLAGHTHGGQIDLPFFGLIQLDKEYHDIACGLFEWTQPNALVKTAQMFVSRGFGYRHLPLRLRCPAEMHIITLRAK